MHGLYFLYITYQAEGLSVHGPYEKRDEAENFLLHDTIDTLGFPLEPDESASIVNDAYTKRGFEIDGVDRENMDDIIMYLREIDTREVK